MKKLFTMFMAVAFALSVAGLAIAADEKKAPAPAPAADKKMDAPKPEKKAEKAAKPKTQQVTGTIEALDAAAGTFTVKGKKGNVDLKAGEKVKLGDFKVGDKVLVKYADGTAKSVTAVKAKKADAKKDDGAKGDKKADKKADAPKPAPAPAPAEKK